MATLLLGSCGGGGGGEGPPPPPAETTGVFTGFSGNLDWESAGGDGAGVGAGADGDGGVGAGGDFGQFRGATVTVWLENGTLLGSALTDDTKGMVTIKPGRGYRGLLRVRLTGGANAFYYEEGRNELVPFPAGREINVWVPAVTRNIGLTAFTEAAYRQLCNDCAPGYTPTTQPTAAQIRVSNDRVREVLNRQFPSLLHVDDITRLPFIKSGSLTADQIDNDPRGRYGIVNGAFSKQASVFDGDRRTPTLDAAEQLAKDLLDGQLDGRNGSQPAVPAAARTYDPNTLTGELSAALAEQARRFGKQAVRDTLPPVVNYGNVRYEGYLFDGSISKEGVAHSTVAGWVGSNSKNFRTGQEFDRLPGQRAASLFSNSGHGGGFYKADVLGQRHKIYAIGDNVNGELGLGTRNSTQAAAIEVTALNALGSAVTHIAGGFAHTVARLADGSVYAWGDDSFGQLGQGSSGTASLTPVRVTLPAGAVAVAATNMASYALLVDGSVWAWGSNGGFGLLGNGQADGIAATPAQVAGLADIVQISARDNDVAVLKRDNTIWHWGSFPADASAFVPGNPAAPYLGGTRTPTQLAGLPAGAVVRKLLSEQSLFAALLDNGHVYTWGVYFDITAGQILRDLTAQRVLGLPPVRDMMPGGFIGYGVRAFDRMTAMGVDYSGGMWKIRGRVAEVFDPATEASRGAQRRPQGQGPRVDCQACHIFLEQALPALRAASTQPTSGTECVPPSSAHAGLAGSLIHAETECVMCHNPARLNQPVNTPSGQIPFAASGGWPNCAKPSTLAARSGITPPLITAACTIPSGHVFTPPGTVCASCHNSVVARPLSESNCVPPRADELPTIATVATVSGLFDDSGAAIAAGSVTRDGSPEVRGTLSAGLQGAQQLAVYRNGVRLGTPAIGGTLWSLVDSGAPDGSATYTARVVDASGFGAASNAIAVTIDATPPAAAPTVTAFGDDALGAISPGQFAADTTPAVAGSVNGALGAGESVQVLRNGSVVGTAAVAGAIWTFTEPSALAAGVTYSYQARAVDAAGNTGTLSAASTLTILAGVGTATITHAVNDANAVIASGGSTTDTTPALQGTISSGLAAGHVLRIYRNNVLAGAATVTGQAWSFTDAATTDGSYSYAARIEAGAVQGALSATFALTIDTVAPAQIANVTAIEDSSGALANGATTVDTRPVVRGTLSAQLGSGEQLRLLRNGSAVATFSGGTSWSYTEPAALTSNSYQYQAQVVDAAGLTSALGAARTVVINTSGVPLQGAATQIVAVNGANLGNATSTAVSNDNTPTLTGTIERALNTAANEVVRIYRGQGGNTPVAVGTAVVSGTGWSYSNGALADGSYVYRARIEYAGNAAVFGQTSASITVPIDTTAPAQTVTIASVLDDAGTNFANNGYTTDTTPRIAGTVAALDAGDILQVLRGSVVVGTATVTGTSWAYQETVALAGGAYTYTARVRDAAGNDGASTAPRTVNVVTNLPNTTITAINGSVTSPLITNNRTPTVSITLAANLPASYVVRVLRDGSSVGTVSNCSPSCTFTEPTQLPQTAGTTYSYTARTEVGGTAIGAVSNARSIFLDTVAPDQPTVAGFVTGKPYQNTTTLDIEQPFASGATVGHPTPRIVANFTAPLAANERVQIWRNSNDGLGWSVVADETMTSSGSTSYSYNESAHGLRIPSNGSPSVLVPTRWYVVRRFDAAGNVSPDSATFTVNHGYLNCSAQRAQARSQNHAAYTTGSGATATFTASITTCGTGGCHSSPSPSGSFVAAPAVNFPGRYWCVR